MTLTRPIVIALAVAPALALTASPARAEDGGADRADEATPVEPADDITGDPGAPSSATLTSSTAAAGGGPVHPERDRGTARSSRRTGRFVLGAGFSPDEGFLAHAAVVQDDLFGTGQRLALSADLSAVHQSFHLVHEVPDLLSSGLDLRSELFSTRRQFPGFVREGQGGALTVGHRLDRTTRVFLRYRIEEVGLELDRPSATSVARNVRGADLGGGTIASLGAGVTYDTLDAPYLPSLGTRVALFGERADRRLGSDHDLMKISASLDHARPLGPFTLRVQGRGAYVRALGPGGVPLSERLQHAGHADVRGYPVDAIGLLALPGSDGLAAGADLAATGRLELELPVIRSAGLSIAAFADVGARYNADPSWGATGATLHRSVGASIIWRSPIGPLRFDWAVPLDREDHHPVFLFGLGASF
jgi:outer membrane protein insertion porin family